MFDLPLARCYGKAGYGLGGVLLKQSLYPGKHLLPLLDGAALVLDFGCGEGLLTNLLARSLPRTRFVGVDLDEKKISAATSCRTSPFVEFRAGDFFDHKIAGADAVIFNDVLHHLPPERQLLALQHAADCLTDDGIIILKEVDPADRWDVRHTTFWDNRLYSKDELRFFSPTDWHARLRRVGFRSLGSAVVRHPWVASRTMMWFTRCPKLDEFAPPLVFAPASAAMQSVLVTGATGFIGEWVVRDLLARGLNDAAVRVDLIVRQPGRVPPDIATHAQVRLLTGDLTDGTFMNSLSDTYAAIFHLAAAVDYFGGEQVFENNLRATTGLLSACTRLKPGRFVYTSTMGALDRSRWDFSRQPLNENSASHPTSPYGRAKFAEEKLVRESGLDWTIARIPWCYGPGMAESHHVRNLLNRVRNGSAVCRINWPGKVSIIEVRQAARKIVDCVSMSAAVRETFFLAEDEPMAIGELFAEMGRTIGATSAASLRFPAWVWGLLRSGLPLLPFQLKCLLSDALVVSTAHARKLGITVPARTSEFLVPLARYNANQLFPSRHRSAALITGAAGGIGACLARQLHARGFSLILADRNEAPLRERCSLYPGARAWSVDLARDDFRGLLQSCFPAELPWPALIINNAGVGWRGNSWDSSPSDSSRVVAVNATAPVIISNFFLRHSPAPITVVNVASTAAFQPLPYMAAYAAAKSFVLSFSLAVEAELRASGRHDRVVTVVPGGTKTSFQSTAGVGTNPKEKLLSPDDVATTILRGVNDRKTLVFIGHRARVMSLAASFIPWRLQASLWEKLMRNLR
jgi:uncharacterized protein